MASDPVNIPSGFAIIRTLSGSVLRHWPPSEAVRNCIDDKNAWNASYDAALLALDDLQRDIKATLAKTAKQILHARNNASPANKFPIEVLRHIFMQLDGDVEAKLAVSHTCRLWREIMIQDPFLWTRVDLDTLPGPKVASRIFRRAKEYPLQLSCHHWNDLRLSCASFEMARVEELDTTFSVDMFRNLSKRSAPLLKKLRIIAPVRSHAVMYLPYFFSQHHPNLRELTMIDCRLIFTVNNYRDLTRLTIRFTRPMISLRQDEDFLDVFANCPGLESVRLENMCLYREEPVEVIPLPRLQTMHIRSFARDANILLSMLSPPHSLRLSVVTYGSLWKGNNETPLAPQPTLRLLTETKHLELDDVTKSCFAFRETGARTPSWCHRVVDTMAPIASDILQHIASVYPMPLLETVRLRNIEPEAIIQLLRRSAAIKVLEIIYTDEGFGNTTLIPLIMQTIRGDDTPLLPNLHTLRLERVYIDINDMFNLVELRRTCPKFRKMHLHFCHGDLPPGELTQALDGEFEVADWSPRSLIVEGQPHNDLEEL